MTPEFNASLEASKTALIEQMALAMDALEKALVIATNAGKTDSELSPLYKALAATLLVKIAATNEVMA